MCKKVFIDKQAGDVTFDGDQGLDPRNPVVISDDDEGAASDTHGGNHTCGNGEV